MRVKLNILLVFFFSLNNIFAQNIFDAKKEELQNEDKKESIRFKNNFFNGLISKSNNDIESSIDFFQKCIKIAPKEPAPFYELSIIYKDLNMIQEAIKKIKKALALDPHNYFYTSVYAELLVSYQDYQNAAKQYEKLISSKPKNEELYFVLAQIYLFNNKHQEAINTYNKLESRAGVSKIVSLQKYKIHIEKNKKEDAIKEIKNILKSIPDDIELLEILSELYLLNNQKKEAFDVFKTITEINPKNGRVRLMLADYYRENNENEKSFEQLKIAFESEDLDVETKARILISYIPLIQNSQQMKNQAYQLSTILLKKHKNNPKVKVVYADILYTDNKLEEAKKQYKEVLQSDSTKIEVWLQILFICSERNNYNEMVFISEKALDYFPSHPIIYYFNAISNKQLEEYEKSLQTFKEGLDFIIDDNDLLSEFYSSMADIYNQLKQYGFSDSLYEKVLRINPKNTIVLNNYSYYLSLRKEKLELAKKMSKFCNELEKNNPTYEDTYAWVLYQKGEIENAYKWIKKAIKNGGGESAVIVEHYGDILYKMGRKKDALKKWIEAENIGDGSDLLKQKIQHKKLYE